MEKIFEALASTPRRKILAYLSKTSLTAGEIAERFEMSKPAVSKHLKILENAGLINGKKIGQFVHYNLVEGKLVNNLNSYLATFCPVGGPLKKESAAIGKAKKKRVNEFPTYGQGGHLSDTPSPDDARQSSASTEVSNPYATPTPAPNAEVDDFMPVVNERPKTLPFSKWLPFIGGVGMGLLLRLIFVGEAGNPWAPMMGAFIYFAPVLVSVVTVYLAERVRRRSWVYYFWAPALANVLFVIGTMVIMIEGLICAVVIVPLFAFIGAVAGLIMGAVCRATNWPKQVVYSFAILPLILGGLETYIPLPDRVSAIERTVVIQAPPDMVWRQILNATDIKSEEVDPAWAYRIGVPVPLSGVTEETAVGRVRKVRMGKGVYFDQVYTDSHENRYMRWTYRFHPDSFPRKALDDHVLIGGHYFDLKDTSYTLTPKGNATELKIKVGYRVSTQFNWYADTVAQLLLGNVGEINIDFYRTRAEAEQRAVLTP